MTKHILATARKHLVLSPGLRRRTKAQLFPLAKIAGSRSEKAIESRTRNGKTQDPSGQTIGNMFLATNVRSRVLMGVLASMFALLCETISGWKRRTLRTGGLWS